MHYDGTLTIREPETGSAAAPARAFEAAGMWNDPKDLFCGLPKRSHRY
ncbi:MAG: hypothetical protein ACI8Q9_000469 [Planctomycetota bacterium]|jgi:hypothetical protein